ncbi:MAG: chorismate-binding protein [Cryomorphaceae bacterium]|nr:chorismate-binding protein [Cryomorphaceae bacterium]
MIQSDAILACRFPGDQAVNYYDCKSCDAEVAQLVWASFENDNPRYFNISKTDSSVLDSLTFSDYKQGKEIGKAEYFNTVKRAKDLIDAGEVKKIVISRYKVVPIPSGFTPLKFFNNLCENFPGAFIYVMFCEGACWIGATPELLLETEGNNLKTMSLAGTQWPVSRPDDVFWSDKERAEQGWVTRYLKERLQSIGVKDIVEKGPYTRRAGHLVHLCTEIHADRVEKQNPFSLANHLHPTPAVCGYPSGLARDFILKNEGYQRGYYAGYIGLGIDSEKKHSAYVNLRCMQVFSDAAVLYAGGGITSDSSPEKEWEETEQKLKVLRHLIAAL